MAYNRGYNNNAYSNQVLWLGDVDETMDEDFLKKSFADVGESPEYVRIMRSKEGAGYSSSGYAFVGFRDETTAQRVLASLNGAAIPNTDGKRFKLNSSIRNPSHQNHYNQNRHNNNQSAKPAGPQSRASPSGPPSWSRGSQRFSSPRLPEYTAYIGDMTTDVGDGPFFDLFRSNYPSVHAAHIMRLPDGSSKGFAFVRFRDEAEYTEALTHEGRISGLLGCQIRICKAHPRPTQLRQRFSGPGHLISSPMPGTAPRLFHSAADPVLPHPLHATPGPQLIDPSGIPAKYQANPGVLAVNVDHQRLQQTSPCGQQQHHAQHSQPFLTDQMQAVYYIPVPGYPYPPDPNYWPSWQDVYSALPLSSTDLSSGAQQAYGQAMAISGVPEAGDSGSMQSYHSYPPTAWQQIPLPLQHQYLQEQRFPFSAAEAAEAGDMAKDPSTGKTDQFQD